MKDIFRRKRGYNYLKTWRYWRPNAETRYPCIHTSRAVSLTRITLSLMLKYIARSAISSSLDAISKLTGPNPASYSSHVASFPSAFEFLARSPSDAWCISRDIFRESQQKQNAAKHCCLQKKNPKSKRINVFNSSQLSRKTL